MIKFLFILFFIFNFSSASEDYYSIKGGILSHSSHHVSSGKEDGTDINVELQFNKKFLHAYYSVGADINTNSDTSFIYGGLSWEGKFFDRLLLGVFFGAAIHDGELNQGSLDRRQLGSRITFREGLDIGFFFTPNLSISLMVDHYSNLGIGDARNQGNDNLGVRIGYYF